MPDYPARRTMMVDTQIRPSDVTKFPIIDAFLRIPREVFVPPHLREAAYAGENLMLGDGNRCVLEPRTLAKMLDALNISRSELVLDVGCGLGYSTAVIAQLAQAVVGVEANDSFAAEAQTNLGAQAIDNAVVQNGPLTDGDAQHGPYDVIVVQGGAEVFPETLAAQLKDGGRVACLFMSGALGVVRLGVHQHGTIAWRDIFNAAAPVIAGFGKTPEFTL
ncbi:protein-L-isoaspartate O-methyltransferase family protein [Roseicitreum antarcticum]|uniref:Protein-L-isoaspartate O-methyltransferase n=1 Tax=Roseicitreum antarcticum TaxID=564137 RepID=A0A1H2XH52_9RHOB|nr:protein-L-isoaspartate O-methyltransferase [Roseicitreum antarcticum]SDW91814.1 protein-L-isoaspartate(D-aspartate) O-methyltransferase [Roseicitreum antarcticum]